MRDEHGRLVRLARAQSELARLVEIKIMASRQNLEQLEQTRAGILLALDRVGGTGLALHAATMRRLASICVAEKAAEAEIAGLNRKLLKVRLRQEVLTQRARQARLLCERKVIEEETLEVSLGMHRKATGKPGMLE